MDIKTYGISDIGLVRQINEDYYIINENYGLFLVADGMGGHKAGDIASKLASTTIEEFISAVLDGEDITWPYDYDDTKSYLSNVLQVAVKLANRRILSIIKSDSSIERMGTTVVALLLDRENRKAHIANVGDSRLYLIRNSLIEQISDDHSFTNEQVKSGKMNKEEARLSPYKNIITRAIGIYEELQVDTFDIALKPDDLFILATDGLTNMVTDSEILDISINNPDDLSKLGEQLLILAKRRGGDDNITSIIIKTI